MLQRMDLLLLYNAVVCNDDNQDDSGQFVHFKVQKFYFNLIFMPAKPDQQKSVRKVKKEATQEFFNKKRSTSVGDSTKKSQTFTFNKAPINRAEAK